MIITYKDQSGSIPYPITLDSDVIPRVKERVMIPNNHNKIRKMFTVQQVTYDHMKVKVGKHEVWATSAIIDVL